MFSNVRRESVTVSPPEKFSFFSLFVFSPSAGSSVVLPSVLPGSVFSLRPCISVIPPVVADSDAPFSPFSGFLSFRFLRALADATLCSARARERERGREGERERRGLFS